MPRRKQRSSGPEAFDEQAGLLRIVKHYGDVFEDGLIALNYGQGVKAFESAMDALTHGDQKEIDRRFAKWLEPYIDAFEGRDLRDRARRLRQGKNKKILDRSGAALYDSRGKPVRVKPDDLRDAVEVLRKNDVERYPPNGRRTFNDICGAVALKFGYKQSARQVKLAADAIKWIDPRRASK